MTEAEIEKQAEEHLRQGVCQGCNNICEGDCAYARPVKQAFQDGAKWGMEHTIEWHDLRKDQNDLPKEIEICSSPVYVVSKHGSSDLAQYDYSQKLWCYKHSNEHILYEVIKWCELPQFKE